MRAAATMLILVGAIAARSWSQAVPGGDAALKAAAAGTPDASVPVDSAPEWKVGFTVFTATNLSVPNAYLAYSIPLLLKDEVSGIDVHSFSDEERDLARKAILARALDNAVQALSASRREWDALLFADTASTAADRSGVDARIKAGLARLEFLRALDTTSIIVAPGKPVTFLEGSGAGKLLDAPEVPAAAFCARNGIDLLVGGSVTEVQGYLLVDVWVFDALRGMQVVSARDAAQREELYAELPDVSRKITGAVLGRDWTLVAFAPDPPESSLYVDETLVASGASPALYLDPGARMIRVSAPGYSDAESIWNMGSGATIRIEDKLQKLAPGTIAIASTPPGATVYLDSRWIGLTPITVDRPATRSRGVLDLTGYYEVPFSLAADSSAELTFTLPVDAGSRDALQKKARDEFYASFGWFAASLPLPVFSYGFVIAYAVQEQDFLIQGRLADAAQAEQTSRLFLTGYYGGIAVSASLFAWMVIRIIRYVAVSNEIAG